LFDSQYFYELYKTFQPKHSNKLDWLLCVATRHLIDYDCFFAVWRQLINMRQMTDRMQH